MLTDYLNFLSLGSPVTLASGDDNDSGAISSSEYIGFGFSTERTVYVSVSGEC